MSSKWKVASWILLATVVGGTLVAVGWVQIRKRRQAPSLIGAVVRQDADPRKESPISGVEIRATNDLAVGDCKSDASGFFRLPLRPGIKPTATVNLVFEHAGYKPLAMEGVAINKICVAPLEPIAREVRDARHPDIVIANIDVKYSIKASSETNVGSVVRTFQAVNTGNVPCNDRWPCSPNGRWKAAVGSITLDAGQGNEFRNARISCIAGPCPFTKVRTHTYSHGGRTLVVSVLAWSNTATFLLEAEVDRVMISDTARESYPVTFGEALNFTLPVGAEEVFIEAELNGAPIVFPLGPDLILSWADCNATVNSDRTRAYRCTLKPGYRFQ